MKPVYFDMSVKNLEPARRFFEHVLGWQFEKYPMPYEYYRITAGKPDEPGIDGGIGEVKDAPVTEGRPLTVVTVPVSSIDETMARVRKHGGSIIEGKAAIPGIGWYATCTEPGGLKFGILQIDQEAE